MAGRGGKRRDPAREQFWRRTVRRQQCSGLTIRDFCRREGLKDWTFRWWQKELARRDPMTGHLFVFRSRRGDRLKVLWWDRDGYALWYKRLERGGFHFPACEGESVEVKAADLAMILEGIDLASVRRRPRYSRPPVEAT